jgi:RimJ/RimL family protein N-acetyltransferase
MDKPKRMRYRVEPATPEDIAAIDAYRYDPPYDFYNGDDDPVQNPERFFAVHDARGDRVGFYYFDWKGDALEIGLGLRPDLTGRRLGLDFLREGLAFARSHFGAERIVLNVAAFNERAIKVYERAGFRRTGDHVRTFARWGAVPFIEMELVR